MGVDICSWRAAIGFFNGCRFRSHGKFVINVFDYLLKALIFLQCHLRIFINVINIFFNSCFKNNDFKLILICLLLEAGDVESNPGPTSSYCLSLLHCNIRSIRNKLEYISDFFTDNDILCFTETHLNELITTNDIIISDKFDNPYRKDRTNHGGGIPVYI